MLARTDVRDAYSEIPAEFAFVSGVELFDAWTLKVNRNGVRGKAPEVVRIAHADRAAGKWRDAARINASGQSQGVPLCDSLIKAVRRQRVSHALRRRGRVEHAVAAAQHITVSEPPRDAESRREVILISLHKSASDARFISSYHAIGEEPRIE